ncbi:MAG TPA: hypothetical protein VGO97_02500 [Solirubrobacterales bacterium]|jgi:hypothetical protein|nr:hypothetical protein [Solirubrobacterales bacterium]
MSLEAKMLENIVRGLEHHDKTCPMPPRAVLLNPGNHELFGWDEINGVPVEPSDSVAPERFRIDCSGSANGIEDALEEFMIQPVELPVESPGQPVPAITPARTPFGPFEDDVLDDQPLDPYRW